MGTLGYLSPETVNSTHYTNKTDIWAVGVIVYELTHGRAFAGGLTDKDKFRWLSNVQSKIRQVLNSRLHVDGSYLLEGFLRRVLTRQELRPEARELLLDPFITNFRN